MFWKKKKEIVLNCYTCRADVYNFYPVVDASKKIPQWFKQIPAPIFKKIEDYNFTLGNLKQCVGFLDYYKKGFILPLWSDLSLTIGPKNTSDYRWQFSDKESEIDTHSPEQTNHNFDPELYQHLKLISPWLFLCDEDISFLAVEPGWHFDVFKTISILSGALNFKYQCGTNVNLFCRREEIKTEFLFEAGTPLCHYVPLTERKVVLKTHLISQEQYARMAKINSSISFNRYYEKRKKILKTSGCPFQHELSTRD